MKRSKRYRKNKETKESTENIKNISNALDFILNQDKPKFDESLEVHVNLNIDHKKTDQYVKFMEELPNGVGKEVKVAVFAEGEQAKEAEKAGADVILGENDIERIKNKKMKLDFDAVLAHPSMMPKIAKVAKILGPKGLMPSPKNQTVTTEITKMVESLKKGMITVKNDSTGIIHVGIGKLSFGKDKLMENYKTLIKNIEKNKPQKIKGKLIKKVYVSSSMGPSAKVVG